MAALDAVGGFRSLGAWGRDRLPVDAAHGVDVLIIATPDDVVAEVAAANPQQATLVALNAVVSPGGKFASSVNGVVIRAPDGIHFPYYSLTDPTSASPNTIAQCSAFARWLGPQVDQAIINRR